MTEEIRIGSKVYQTPYANLLRPLTDEEYQALKASIAAQGITSPIVVTEDGQVLDGLHRLRIAKELDLPPSAIPTVVVPGLSEEEKIARAVALNAARRQLAKDELRELVRKLRFEHKLSYRLIMQATGVADTTCHRWCADSELKNPRKILSVDGKQYPAVRPSPEDLAERRCKVLELRDAGYTLEEIADELGVSLGTVHADLQAGAKAKRADQDVRGDVRYSVNIKQRACKESCMKRNVLTAPRMFELIQWIKKHQNRLLIERPPYTVAAVQASQELGFAVTEYNVRTAAQISQCTWRAKPAHSKQNAVDHPTRRLAQEIVRIEDHLGITIPVPILVLARDKRAGALFTASHDDKPV